MIRAALPGGAMLALLAAAPAQSPPALEDSGAFERGFAVSLHQFDACGDALAGRVFAPPADAVVSLASARATS